MSKKLLLKDELFNPKKVHLLANELKSVYPTFQQKEFELEVVSAFGKLELKARITHIAKMLKKYLPSDYETAVNIILKALPPELDPTLNDDDFGDFIYAPYGEFVMLYGCNEEYLEFSLDALAEITKRFSVEFAIRDFINAFPKESLAMLKRCAISENYHQRRLASEGLRPKLPWAKRLTIDYHEPLELLELLYGDQTRYVTRSVANHLNDIAKVDAPLVLETLKRWRASKKQSQKEMEFMVNHALRTLVKEGSVEALALLGYKQNPKVELKRFSIAKTTVQIGEALNFDLRLEAKEETKLMVDYTIFFVTKSGKHSPKVHKLKRLSLKAGESVTLKKRHPFRANMSTRKLYQGEHRIEVQINGRVVSKATFVLRERAEKF